MALKERLKRLEDKANPEEIKIIVSKGGYGCPTPKEKARIRAGNPDKTFIYVCHCPNCCPEDF